MFLVHIAREVRGPVKKRADGKRRGWVRHSEEGAARSRRARLLAESSLATENSFSLLGYPFYINSVILPPGMLCALLYRNIRRLLNVKQRQPRFVFQLDAPLLSLLVWCSVTSIRY